MRAVLFAVSSSAFYLLPFAFRRRRLHLRLPVFDLDGEGHEHVLPAYVDLRRVVGDGIEGVYEPLLIVGDGNGLGLDAEHVLLLVVREAAPLARVRVEDDSPLFTARYRVEA